MFFARLGYVLAFAAGVVGMIDVLQMEGVQLALGWTCGTSMGWGGTSFLLSFKKDNN